MCSSVDGFQKLAAVVSRAGCTESVARGVGLNCGKQKATGMLILTTAAHYTPQTLGEVCLLGATVLCVPEVLLRACLTK